jgi:Mlc titration factor MtfA (ptsG expression regulator)
MVLQDFSAIKEDKKGNPMRPAFIIVLAALLVPLFFVLKRALRSRRIRRLTAVPFPLEWEGILLRNVALYRHLPSVFQDQLRNDIKIFLGEKRFEGLGGLEMTDEIRITIAGQACLLLLNRENRNYPGLVSVLVYPTAYVAEETRYIGGGVYAEGPSIRLGESWKHGSVVLAWDNVKQGGLNAEDGHNVVIHEFTHQLDQEDGVADGAPILGEKSSYAVWAHIMSEEYERLRSSSLHHKKSVLDDYGATNPAEFFAVATEAFFEKSRQLKNKSPYLYAELSEFYNVDPVEWLKDSA